MEGIINISLYHHLTVFPILKCVAFLAGALFSFPYLKNAKLYYGFLIALALFTSNEPSNQVELEFKSFHIIEFTILGFLCTIEYHILYLTIVCAGNLLSNLIMLSSHPINGDEGQSSLISTFVERSFSAYLLAQGLFSMFITDLLQILTTTFERGGPPLLTLDILTKYLAFSYQLTLSLSFNIVFIVICYNLLNGILNRLLPQIHFSIIFSPAFFVVSIWLLSALLSSKALEYFPLWSL